MSNIAVKSTKQCFIEHNLSFHIGVYIPDEHSIIKVALENCTGGLSKNPRIKDNNLLSCWAGKYYYNYFNVFHLF